MYSYIESYIEEVDRCKEKDGGIEKRDFFTTGSFGLVELKLSGCVLMILIANSFWVTYRMIISYH